ncbi:iron/zinc/copper transport system ATP-binding protein [Psychrobacillus psychrotolerans]|uniref:Iron/zinc/copper transport system ATP-binding protein n=1 Tax=Psychrobacillus psychrotolerans TaxID=126156 RepID=A0A1I5YT09_9BACI|nr:metal ABC transporter ATP-binding protein [Psychrobacillus psychrotolerans]SFQ47408.1 iron/zinc/copper transport system ATP-binding protein [Psychrobacillus psychrotolerans]
MKTAIAVKELYVSYFGSEALKNVSFTVEEGKLVGIIGPNGAGKSTLLKALLNLIQKEKGEVAILGKTIKEMRTKVAYVPQRSSIDWDFPITVFDTVLLGTYPKLGVFKRPKKIDKAFAYECLEKVGMTEFRNRQIGELSGGQQQRVFLARALAQEPEIYLLDEPFVGVDVTSEETIILILKQLRDLGKTVVVVHHDLRKAKEYFNELILLNKELIDFGVVEKVIQPEVLEKAYNIQFSPLTNLEAKA